MRRRPPFHCRFRKWNGPFLDTGTGVPFPFQRDGTERKRHRFFDSYCTHASLTQCSSESRASVHVQEPPLKPQQITHTVKLINKARKKEYKIEKLGSIPFSSLESIKAALKDLGGNVSDGIGYWTQPWRCFQAVTEQDITIKQEVDLPLPTQWHMYATPHITR